MAVLMCAKSECGRWNRIRAMCRRAISPRPAHTTSCRRNYIPLSLTQAAFHLGEVIDGISLPQAVAIWSRRTRPGLSRLDDRGARSAGWENLPIWCASASIPRARGAFCLREGRRVA